MVLEDSLTKTIRFKKSETSAPKSETFFWIHFKACRQAPRREVKAQNEAREHKDQTHEVDF